MCVTGQPGKSHGVTDEINEPLVIFRNEVQPFARAYPPGVGDVVIFGNAAHTRKGVVNSFKGEGYSGRNQVDVARPDIGNITAV
ncbi:MAG: hypothetical protein QGF59_04990, partial [Pirellulaceae bacterium]|nr:hypothetical protein [Pirellulaceae bacterium]